MPPQKGKKKGKNNDKRNDYFERKRKAYGRGRA